MLYNKLRNLFEKRFLAKTFHCWQFWEVASVGDPRPRTQVESPLFQFLVTVMFYVSWQWHKMSPLSQKQRKKQTEQQNKRKCQWSVRVKVKPTVEEAEIVWDSAFGYTGRNWLHCRFGILREIEQADHCVREREAEILWDSLADRLDDLTILCWNTAWEERDLTFGSLLACLVPIWHHQRWQSQFFYGLSARRRSRHPFCLGSGPLNLRNWLSTSMLSTSCSLDPSH